MIKLMHNNKPKKLNLTNSILSYEPADKRDWKQAKQDKNQNNRIELKQKFQKVIKLLNRLRRHKDRIEKELIGKVSESQSRKNPYKYCEKLFNSSPNLSPAFSKDEADTFFTNTYKDPNRKVEYPNPPQLASITVPLPKSDFVMSAPDKVTLLKVLKKEKQ